MAWQKKVNNANSSQRFESMPPFLVPAAQKSPPITSVIPMILPREIEKPKELLKRRAMRRGGKMDPEFWKANVRPEGPFFNAIPIVIIKAMTRSPVILPKRVIDELHGCLNVNRELIVAAQRKEMRK